MNAIPRPAGMGASIELPDFDFETYSEAGFHWDESRRKYTALPPVTSGKKKGLPTVGAAAYAMHPSTEVLSLQFDLKDGRGAELWVPDMPRPERLIEHHACGGLLEAWNAAFEYWIWTFVCVRRYGWPAVNPRQLRCAMAKARAFALPGKLEKAGEVLQLAVQKDAEGKRLLDKFSMPRNPTKADPRRRITPADDPADAVRLYGYNGTDIAAEAAVSRVVPDLDGLNLDYWFADQDINRRGVHVDEPSIRAATAIVEQAHERYNAELHALTSGAVDKASEIAKLTAWLHGRGVHLDSLDEESVSAALDRIGESIQDGTEHPDEIRDVWRALEIRQAIGSASVKKLFAMSDQLAPDGRLHDLFSYHAARTGRPTGNGPQPTNLPKAGPKVYRCGWGPDPITRKHVFLGAGCGKHYGGRLLACPRCATMHGPSKPDEWSPEAAEDALEVIATRSLDAVEYVFGDAMLTVAGCLRGLFDAAPGHDLIASDYSAIEAVVLAALAGVEWRLEVFRTHGKIYETAASKAFGVPLDEMLAYPKSHNGQHHPLRQKGKIGELAYGFQGWVGAAKAFDHPGTDDEIKSEILAWRAASPEIVDMWGGQRRDWTFENFGIEGAFVAAMQHRGQTFRPDLRSPNAAARGLEFTMHGDAVYVRLLSGRYLTYHRPRLEPSDRTPGTWSVSFEGWNTNPKNGPIGWVTMRTWGGRLVENIVQATAHDLQRFSILNQEAAGYPIVLHVYDENVAEVPEGWGSVEEFERLMMLVPNWATGWPVKAAGGWRGKRYRKA